MVASFVNAADCQLPAMTSSNYRYRCIRIQQTCTCIYPGYIVLLQTYMHIYMEQVYIVLSYMGCHAMIQRSSTRVTTYIATHTTQSSETHLIGICIEPARAQTGICINRHRPMTISLQICQLGCCDIYYSYEFIYIYRIHLFK